MRKGVCKLAAVVGSVLIGAVTPATAAVAAVDTTRPGLTVQPALFYQGKSISQSSIAPDAPEGANFTGDIPMYITWRGSDASGICGYDVSSVMGDSDLNGTLISGTSQTRYDGVNSDYHGEYGGGPGVTYGWKVHAHDCAGNTIARAVDVKPVVTQENGTNLAETVATVKLSYAGTWATASCKCWSHGAVRKTTQRGASATINFSTRTANSPIALVMEKAPGRGKFTVYLDGVNKGTVDTYAPSASHRVIVWSSKATTAGNHVVRIVNQATAGRPRIDLDAVLTNNDANY